MVRSGAEAWNNLIAEHGEVVACYGVKTDTYWQSGVNAWLNDIAPHLGNLGEAPFILEWGAGTGRLAKAAVAALPLGGRLYAYEPAAEVRKVLDANLQGTGAVVVSPLDLAEVPPLDAIYCVFTMHHMDYDALWEFFGFANDHLAPGGTLLFDYIPITTQTGREFLGRKDSSEWPLYIWHPAQIAALMEARVPRLSLVEVIDRPRELQVWRVM